MAIPPEYVGPGVVEFVGKCVLKSPKCDYTAVAVCDKCGSCYCFVHAQKITACMVCVKNPWEALRDNPLPPLDWELLDLTKQGITKETEERINKAIEEEIKRTSFLPKSYTSFILSPDEVNKDNKVTKSGEIPLYGSPNPKIRREATYTFASDACCCKNLGTVCDGSQWFRCIECYRPYCNAHVKVAETNCLCKNKQVVPPPPVTRTGYGQPKYDEYTAYGLTNYPDRRKPKPPQESTLETVGYGICTFDADGISCRSEPLWLCRRCGRVLCNSHKAMLAVPSASGGASLCPCGGASQDSKPKQPDKPKAPGPKRRITLDD